MNRLIDIRQGGAHSRIMYDPLGPHDLKAGRRGLQIPNSKPADCKSAGTESYTLELITPKQKKEEYFEKEMKRISKLLERFTVLPLPEKADGYGQIKMALRLAGKLADEFDMIIGGQALTTGLTVVTDNVKHFEPMPEVKVENWLTRA